MFLEIAHLLAKYDKVQMKYFQTCTRNSVYTTRKIQNELKACLYQDLIEQLKEELGATTCFGVMMDETSDHTHKEQVSLIIRYVDNVLLFKKG